MDLCSTLRSTLGASDFLKEDPSGPFPGGAADAEAANAMVNAAVNSVAMLFVFIIWVVGLSGVPVGRVSRRTLNTVFIGSYTCPCANPWKNSDSFPCGFARQKSRPRNFPATAGWKLLVGYSLRGTMNMHSLPSALTMVTLELVFSFPGGPVRLTVNFLSQEAQ